MRMHHRAGGGDTNIDMTNPIVVFSDVLQRRLKAIFNDILVLQISCTECTLVSLESCSFDDMLKQA